MSNLFELPVKINQSSIRLKALYEIVNDLPEVRLVVVSGARFPDGANQTAKVIHLLSQLSHHGRHD